MSLIAFCFVAVPAVWTQNPYYMVEFKPALGWVFRDYLKEYTHWAYGDLDVFFGDLTKGWLEASEMKEYDVVTYRSVKRRNISISCPCPLRSWRCTRLWDVLHAVDR